jgi:hypothetical protein
MGKLCVQSHPRRLTKSASFPGESERAGPNGRHRDGPGEPAQSVAPQERGGFTEYWPFRGVLAGPLSTTRARELVAE